MSTESTTNAPSIINDPSPPSVSEGSNAVAALEQKYIEAAQKFWLRFKVNGGEGVDANGLARVFQNMCSAERAPLEARIQILETEVDAYHEVERESPVKKPRGRRKKNVSQPVDNPLRVDNGGSL
jgi:hypothetical protein